MFGCLVYSEVTAELLGLGWGRQVYLNLKP